MRHSADRPFQARSAARTLVAAIAVTFTLLDMTACGPPIASTARATEEIASPAATPSLLPASLAEQRAGTECGTSVATVPVVATQAPTAPSSRPVWSRYGDSGPAATVAWSPDGQLLATTPGDAKGADDTARIWTATGGLVATLTGDTAPIHCMAWSPDSHLVASASEDGSVRLWNRAGHLVRVMQGSDPMFSLAWSPTGSVLAAGAIDFHPPSAGGPTQLPGVVRLWGSDGTLLHSVGTQGTAGKFLNLAWSPDGTLFAAGAVDYASWHADGSPAGFLRTGGSPAWAMAWAPTGAALALGNEDGGVQLVAPNGDGLGSGQFSSDVFALSYAPDGRGLVVGFTDHVMYGRADNVRNVLWSIPTDGTGEVVWAGDGQRLASAVSDGLLVSDSDGKAVSSLVGCATDPVAFAWINATVAAATAQGWICVWHA
jgi:WD40 repeat protein